MSRPKSLQQLLRALLRAPKGPGARDDKSAEPPPKQHELSGNVSRDIELIQRTFGESTELTIRTFEDARKQSAAVVFFSGLVSNQSIAQYVIAPIMMDARADDPVAADEQPVSTIKDVVAALTYGKCVLLRHGQKAAAYDVRSWAQRAVTQSEIEPTQTGPLEAFVEDLGTNIALLRRRLRTETLQTERLFIGNESQTDVRIVYLRGIAREPLVEEVRGRLKEIDIDVPFESNFLEEMTSDSPWSPFPNALMTGRPDRTVAMLVEGHVAVLMDGTPMVMIVPGTMSAFLQAADDYYTNFYVASFTRTIRWIAGIVGLLASAVYVAVISYHLELVPARLLFTIAAGREGVPFPPIVEALLMELAFELLREAGLRVPRQIGQAVSIVGVLIIGDAAVSAGLISPLMIVVVGISAISAFAIPSHALTDSIRILRFPMIILAGLIGLFGIVLGVLLLMALLLSARSFGVPVMTPFAPLSTKGLRDAVIRTPWWYQRHRPWQMVQPGRTEQQPPDQTPRPEPSKEGGNAG